MPLKLHYWNFSFRADIIRMLLGYLKLDYEFVPANQETWAADAQALVDGGFHFPNLPMIEDGDFKLSETHAILEYLSEKYGDGTLCGKDVIDRAVVRQLYGVVTDLFFSLMPAIGSPDYKAKVQEASAEGSTLVDRVKKVESFLQGKEFLVGYFTYVDVYLATIFFFLNNMFQSAEIENPLNTKILYDHAVRVFGLPGVEDWFGSEEFKNQVVPIPWIKICDFVDPSA